MDTIPMHPLTGSTMGDKCMWHWMEKELPGEDRKHEGKTPQLIFFQWWYTHRGRQCLGLQSNQRLLPEIVGILHEDSSWKGKDTSQMSACLKKRKSLKVFLYSLLTYDVLLISAVMPYNRDMGKLNGIEVIPKWTKLWLGFWLRFYGFFVF